MFEGYGTLHYSRDGIEYWLTAEVDTQLGAYYRALMPRHLFINRGRHDSHVTIVRGGKDIPTNLAAWGKYEGERTAFFYEPGVRCGKTYYWLRVVSIRFEDIRTELGLGVEPSLDPTEASYVRPPSPWKKFFHTTIGNSKQV